MNTSHHLAQLLSLSADDFDCYLDSINRLAAIRKQIETLGTTARQPAVVAEALEPQRPVPTPPRAGLPKTSARQLATRRPMRAAKPGTLRGDVHEVLRATGRPLRRAEIINEVAKRRGRDVDEVLRAKVSDILTNPHDPFLRRVAFGTYVYVAGEKLLP